MKRRERERERDRERERERERVEMRMRKEKKREKRQETGMIELVNKFWVCKNVHCCEICSTKGND